MSQRALDPETAKRVANLSFSARKAVEGALSGVHRSPHRGASVVFVEHREYRPGDDLRLLDWRAFARSDRHQIRRFEQETHLRATLVLDRSGSMAYGGEGPDGPRADKHTYAATLLGALAYVLVRQGDAPGLATFDEAVTARLPPRTRPAHLEAVLRELAEPPRKDAETRLGDVLSQIAERAGRRGLVALASDLLDLDDPGALSPLAHLVARGHDVVVFHVLDPDEIELPFDAPARFEGLEGEPSLDADPESLRASYQAEMERFLASCRQRCSAAGARYFLARTDVPVEQALASVLTSARQKGFA